MSAPTVDLPRVAYLPMFTVLTPTGVIVCQSRLLDVALGYWTAGAVLLRDGVPYSAGASVRVNLCQTVDMATATS